MVGANQRTRAVGRIAAVITVYGGAERNLPRVIAPVMITQRASRKSANDWLTVRNVTKGYVLKHKG
jgi:hypothetical protein